MTTRNTMTPREFCIWLEGALDMAEIESDGSVTFPASQVAKIRERLAEATKEEGSAGPGFAPGRPPGVRC